MKYVLIVGLLAALGAMSCGENGQPSSHSAAPLMSAQAPADAGPGASAGNQSSSSGGGDVSDAPAPPKGAQWTIFCVRILGDDHVERTKRMKQELLKKTQMRDWYLIHSDEESTLYYGYYGNIEEKQDAKEARRARNDRSRIVAMLDEMGNRPFESSMFLALESPDPEANSEWNLQSAPRDHFWTLEIAAYADSPDRKRAAVEAVKEARRQGIRAFFYHGVNASSVCIGSWPLEAVKKQEKDAGRTRDPHQTFIVSAVKLPASVMRNLRDENGKKIEVIEPVLEVQDTSLMNMMRQYPEHAVNGEVRMFRTRSGMRPEPSAVLMIPGRESLLHDEGDARPGVAEEGSLEQRALEATGIGGEAGPAPNKGERGSSGGR